MKIMILLISAILFMGSSALAQLLPSYGPSASISSAPAVGPQGSSAYVGPSGVENIRDPYGTAAAASRFGMPGGVENIRDPYGTASAASKFGPPPWYQLPPPPR